ncbi:peptidoglycan DD-metalloendopeptidase family protein [Beggiatoa leptomitoformis]|uniref:Peptidoglycan DD-metalloendopeptidase family protein n=1 Tax=Beggiatoa leptomitoformis TaxID=288004 RepID=A0A2N9YHT3_9GAMM|nr:peptidoglycan DD-metalloendopeptidase family protein [Beggiatoa leptomitoformis]ALG69403.2 peptidoglycan DD-metalloendopeptidase family protein [Beggiatoa leptomitoformis]AUI70023.1 peptidoglycan DD-metalloendopeptidase family protein [Beggiatoa leptomitoformis]
MFAVRHLALFASILLSSACSNSLFLPRNIDKPTADDNTEFSAAASQITYVVKKGDTLYAIARQYNTTANAIARLNGFSVSKALQVGQVIRIATTQQPTTPSKTTPVVVTPAPSRTTTPTPSYTAPTPTYSTPATNTTQKQPLRQVYRGYQQEPEVTVKPTTSDSCFPPVQWIWPTNGRVSASVSPEGRRGIKIASQQGQSVRAAAAGKVVYSGTGTNGYRNLIILQHNNAYYSVYADNRRLLVREGTQVASGQAIAEMGTDSNGIAALHFEIRCRTKAVDPLLYLPPL